MPDSAPLPITLDLAATPTKLPSDDGPAPSPTGRLGDYAIAGRLGAGGMGEVLLVRDASLRRDVAAKVIRGAPTDRARRSFLREAQITGQLAHPYIVPVHSLERGASGELFFTMKRIAGETLADTLERARKVDAGRRTDPAHARRILGAFAKACDAVAYAHSRGVIHRDLKPANVLLGDFGEVLVCDWGLAKIAGAPDDAADAVSLDLAADRAGPLATIDGAVAGTPAYMSPEQARGETALLDARSDVFSLGAILYEILAMVPPFEGTTVWEILTRLIEGNPTPPSIRAPRRAIPRELEAVAMRALAPNPDHRYADARALKADVDAYLDGRLVEAAHYTWVQLVARAARRHRVAAAIATTLAVFFLAYAGHRAGERARLAREHAHEAEARRTAVGLLAPAQRLARARAILEAAPATLRAKETPASLVQREAFATEVRALKALADSCDHLLRIEPTDLAARALLRATLMELARVASLGEDYGVAEFALGQARQLGGTTAELATLDALDVEVARARTLELGHHRAAIDAALAHARAGTLDTVTYAEAVAELASLREPQTVEMLSGYLEAATQDLVEAARAALVAVRLATDDERLAGQGDLDGLDAAAEGFFAQFRLPEDPAPRAMTDAAADLVTRAQQRLVDREVSRRRSTSTQAPPTDALAQLASAQLTAIPGSATGGATWIALVCDALGLLGPEPRSTTALGRYALADWSEERSLPAGRALARHARTDRRAEEILLAIVGLYPDPGAPPPKWNQAQRGWWRQVQPYFRPRAPLPQPMGEDANALYAHAVQLIERGEHDAASALIARALELDPRHAPSHDGRGLALMRQGRVEDATLAFARAIELDPGRGLFHRHRGQAHRLSGHGALALADLDRAIELEPTQADYLNERARIHDLLGAHDRAVLDCRRATELAPHEVVYRLNLANALRRAGRAEAAAEETERAVDLAPDDARVQVARGDLAYGRGDRAGALAAYTRAVEIDPRDAGLHLRRGEVRLELGDAPGAIDDYTRALELDPTNARAMDHRAMARQVRGDYTLALDDCARALELAPEDGWFYNTRGLVKKGVGDLAGAEADFGRAIDLAGPHPIFHLHRGIVRLDLGDTDGSIADLDRAIELDPAFARAYNSRGQARTARGDLVGAEADLAQALLLDPTMFPARVGLAWVRIRESRFADAEAEATRALTLAPTCAPALFARAKARDALGRSEPALADYRRAAELAPQMWPALVEAARILAASGRGDEAAALLRAARERAPVQEHAGIDRRIAEIGR